MSHQQYIENENEDKSLPCLMENWKHSEKYSFSTTI